MSDEASRRTILLVEDQAVIAMDETKRIERFGYDVITSHSGEEAVDLCQENTNIHLVLMDIDLGSGMDGTEAATRILENREIPIVFLTSHTEKEYVDRVKQITRYRYILKNSGDFVLQSSIEMAFELFDAFTSLKEHQNEIKKNEAFLRKIFEILPIGLWIADENGTLQKGNPAGVRIWGDEPHVGQDEYGVFKARRLPSGEEIQPYDWALAHSVNEGVTIKDELLEIDTLDGKKKIILNYTAPVLDDNNNIQGAIIVNQDITERKMAENTLLEKEQKYRLIFNNAPLGLLRFDNKGVITECNDIFVSIIGSSREKLIGLNMLQLPDTRVTGSIQKMFEEKKTTSIEITYSSVTADKVTPIRIIFAPVILDNGEINGGIMIIEDITERKQTENELRESEERYRRILEEIEDGYYEVDLAGRFVSFNDSMCRMLGYGPGELTGIHFREYADEENSRKIFEAFNSVYRSGKPTRESSWVLFTTAGEKKYIEASVSLIKNENGEPTGFRGIARDITAHKESEMAIHDLLQQKSDLLNELQHRVKNSMQLMSSLVNIELGNTQQVDTRNSLETIHGQIQSLSSLYTLLYDTGSIHTVKLDVYFLSIVNSLKSTYTAQNNKVTFNEKYAPIAFDAKKATSLGLIVNELVTNALKHAFPGELHGTIYVELREDSDSITLAVSDDGVSLPSDFNPDESGGTGMKLVSMLAKQLKGTFSANQNKTTSFVISIPIV